VELKAIILNISLLEGLAFFILKRFINFTLTFITNSRCEVCLLHHITQHKKKTKITGIVKNKLGNTNSGHGGQANVIPPIFLERCTHPGKCFYFIYVGDPKFPQVCVLYIFFLFLDFPVFLYWMQNYIKILIL